MLACCFLIVLVIILIVFILLLFVNGRQSRWGYFCDHLAIYPSSFEFPKASSPPTKEKVGMDTYWNVQKNLNCMFYSAQTKLKQFKNLEPLEKTTGFLAASFSKINNYANNAAKVMNSSISAKQLLSAIAPIAYIYAQGTAEIKPLITASKKDIMAKGKTPQEGKELLEYVEFIASFWKCLAKAIAATHETFVMFGSELDSKVITIYKQAFTVLAGGTVPHMPPDPSIMTISN